MDTRFWGNALAWPATSGVCATGPRLSAALQLLGPERAGGNVALQTLERSFWPPLARHGGHIHTGYDVRVIHATTGEIIRTLTIDPDHRYHGTGRLPGGPKGPRKIRRSGP